MNMVGMTDSHIVSTMKTYIHCTASKRGRSRDLLTLQIKLSVSLIKKKIQAIFKEVLLQRDSLWCNDLKIDLLSVSQEDETSGVVEENPHTVVTQLVAQPILVRVVDPLADPVDRNGCRVLGLLCKSNIDCSAYQFISKHNYM